MSPEGLVAAIALVVSLLTALAGLVWRASHRLARIELQLYPDHGQSLRDRVDLLERKLDVLVAQSEESRLATRRIAMQLLRDTPGE